MHHVRGNHDAMLDPTLAVQDAPCTLVDLPGRHPRRARHGDPGDRRRPPPGPTSCSGSTTSPAERTRPVLVFGHHHCWNVEAPRPSTDGPYFGIRARRTAEALVAVFARHDHLVGYFAGHTHTNRVRRFAAAPRTVPFAEVACTKDYPGAWAEYRVYEGGYTQVMRRVAAPAAFAWAERCRSMIQGIYGELVLGGLEHRCFAVALLSRSDPTGPRLTTSIGRPSRQDDGPSGGGLDNPPRARDASRRVRRRDPARLPGAPTASSGRDRRQYPPISTGFPPRPPGSPPGLWTTAVGGPPPRRRAGPWTAA